MPQESKESKVITHPTTDYKFAKRKYIAIRERAFKSYLDLFLIVSYIRNRDLSESANLDTFKMFNHDNKQIPEAMRAYQLKADKDEFHGTEVKELDNAINAWHNNHPLAPYKEFFKAERFIGVEEFKQFYGYDELNRKCKYCDITEKEIEHLIEYRQINTKRLSTRGHRMEVDQKHPHKGYVKGNIVICCYWCNNAKTDEFSYGEFIPIGEQMRRIWEERLNKINDRG